MYAIPWQVALFVSLPEAFLIVILGFALFNLEISCKKALTVSIINATTIYFVRQLQIVFGLHTLIAIIVMVIACMWLTKLHPWNIFTSILTGFVIMGVLQSLLLPICFAITGTSSENLIANPLLNIAFFVPIAALAAVLLFSVKKYKLYIFDLKKTGDR
ncbi:MAG: hypothetical protein H5T98_02480 [Syntrophomonadaceae bacterium]|nr:hypothetical protein [Syntrophomonadaceae bacterium]